MVGTGTAFQLEAPTVAYAMGTPESGSHIMKIYWISDVCARFIGGLLAAVLSRIVNRYLFIAGISF